MGPIKTALAPKLANLLLVFWPSAQAIPAPAEKKSSSQWKVVQQIDVQTNSLTPYTGCVDFFFNLNLLPPNSLCVQGDKQTPPKRRMWTLPRRRKSNHNVMQEIVLSTSSLIWPSYQMRATIYQKLFFPQIMSNNSCFATKSWISSRTCKISSRTFIAPALYLMLCLSALLETTALIASLLCQKYKQAIISSQEDK